MEGRRADDNFFSSNIGRVVTSSPLLLQHFPHPVAIARIDAGEIVHHDPAFVEEPDHAIGMADFIAWVLER